MSYPRNDKEWADAREAHRMAQSLHEEASRIHGDANATPDEKSNASRIAWAASAYANGLYNPEAQL